MTLLAHPVMTELVLEVLSAYGHAERMYGTAARASQLLEEAATLAQELDDTMGSVWSRGSLAVLCIDQDNVSTAANLITHVLPSAQKLGAPVLFAWAVTVHGRVAVMQNETQAALPSLVESLLAFRNTEHLGGVAYVLESFATLAIAQRRGAHAAHLLAAANSRRNEAQLPVASTGLSAHERRLAAARALLDEQAFDVAWDKGQAMTMEQVIAVVLEDVSAGQMISDASRDTPEAIGKGRMR